MAASRILCFARISRWLIDVGETRNAEAIRAASMPRTARSMSGVRAAGSIAGCAQTKVHHMDAKVGGTFKMSFTNFATGKSHSFGGEYLELTPHECIRYTDKFDD